MNISEQGPQRLEHLSRQTITAIDAAEGWVGECSGGETAIALGIISLVKSNLLLERRLNDIAEHLERK
jgi:hypothetical protein